MAGPLPGGITLIDMQWEEPPAAALAKQPGEGGFYGKVAAALRERPGVWAKVPRDYASEDSAKNTRSRLHSGRMAGVPKGEFEAVCHGKSIWMRAVKRDGTEGSVHPIRQAPTAPPSGEAALIRKWAQEQGRAVPKHGRLPQELIDAYEEAHP